MIGAGGHKPRLLLLAVTSTMLVAAGCGGSNGSTGTAASSAGPAQTSNGTKTTSSAATPSTVPDTASTAAARTYPPELTMGLHSLVKLNPIASRYTCAGRNISLPLSWSGIPPKTRELDLFVFTLPGEPKHIADWAVAGIHATTHGLGPGRLPAGAVLGRNSEGQARYSICPSKGTTAHYLVHLYALPTKIAAKPGFDPNALRQHIQQQQVVGGILEFSYTRR
jgi:phosphatidylethanolamine-binding protein (PEBP) family uncharacterized protein